MTPEPRPVPQKKPSTPNITREQRLRCRYCKRWFDRHHPWCLIVNPIGWAKRGG